jgi:hypothetical protein
MRAKHLLSERWYPLIADLRLDLDIQISMEPGVVSVRVTGMSFIIRGVSCRLMTFRTTLA